MKGPVYLAISRGHLEVAKFLLEKYPQTEVHEGLYCNRSSIEIACSEGYFDVVVWFFEKYLDTTIHDGFIEACAKGRLDIAKYLVKKYTTPSVNGTNLEDLCNIGFVEACGHGHLEMAKWFVESFPELDVYTDENLAFEEALQNGHLDVVEWLVDNYDLSAYKRIMLFCRACRSGCLEMVKLLDKKYPHVHGDTSSFAIACGHGHTDVVKYLVESHPNYYPLFISFQIGRTRDLGYTDLCNWLETWVREYERSRFSDGARAPHALR
jgi:hypothetical protein